MQTSLKHPYMVLIEWAAASVLAVGSAAQAQNLKNHVAELNTQNVTATSLSTRSHLSRQDLWKIYATPEYVSAYLEAKKAYGEVTPDNNWTDIPYNAHHQHDWFIRLHWQILDLSDAVKQLNAQLDDLAKSADVQNDPKKLGRLNVLQYMSRKEMITALNGTIDSLPLADYLKNHNDRGIHVTQNGRELLPWVKQPVPSSFDTLDPETDEHGCVRTFLFAIDGALATAANFRTDKNYDPSYFQSRDPVSLAKYDSSPLTSEQKKFIFQEAEAKIISQDLGKFDAVIQRAFTMLEAYGFPAPKRKLPQYIAYGTLGGKLTVDSVEGNKLVENNPHGNSSHGNNLLVKPEH